MKTLAVATRTWFGTQAVVFVSTILFLIYDVFNGMPMQAHSALGLVIVVTGLSWLALLSGIAWWMMRSGAPGARTAVFWVSLVCLPLIPLGFMGLILCAKDAVHLARKERSEEDPKVARDGTHKWFSRLAVVGHLAFLIWGGTRWGKWGEAHGIVDNSWGIPVVAAAIMLDMLVHETGHALAGWAMEMRLLSFTVGPVIWRLRNGRSRWDFKWQGLLGGGSAGLIPTHLRDLDRRMFVAIAGGPAASFLLAVASTALVLSSPGSAWQPLFAFLALLSTLAAASAFTNLLPLRGARMYSDGARMLQILRRGPISDLHDALLMVSSSLFSQLRPADFDEAMLERATNVTPGTEQAMLIWLYRTMRHFDRGEWQLASTCLAEANSIEALQKPNPERDAQVLPEFIALTALLQRDLAQVRTLWKRYEAADKDRDYSYWMTRAAWLWLEGSVEDAWSALDVAGNLATSLPRTGAYAYDRQTITMLQSVVSDAWRDRQAVHQTPELQLSLQLR